MAVRGLLATRRWYLILGAVVVLSMIGAGISAVLAATGHVVVGNGVDKASTTRPSPTALVE